MDTDFYNSQQWLKHFYEKCSSAWNKKDHLEINHDKTMTMGCLFLKNRDKNHTLISLMGGKN